MLFPDGSRRIKMELISVREHPEHAVKAYCYFRDKWADENSQMVHEDCIMNCLSSPSKLPQWYLLMEGEEIIGSVGLIPNDFISRMDLYPWLCSLYIEKPYRGKGYPKLLIERVKKDAKDMGFSHLYLCTDHDGYYEKHGFTHIGKGYHPWGECSKIYEIAL